MPDTTRTFVAVAVPEALAPKLTRFQERLGTEIPTARWATTPPFHATLAFLGDVEHAHLNDVCRHVAEACLPIEPFELRIEGLGAFPDPVRPRVIWTGLTGPGAERLATLQAEVLKAVAAAGYRINDTRFHPHITLGRLKPGRQPSRDVTPLIKHYRTWHADSFRVAEVITFASTLTTDGPVYTPLGRAPLRGGKPRTIA